MDAIPIYVRVKPIAYWYRIDRSHLLHCQLMPRGSWPCVKSRNITADALCVWLRISNQTQSAMCAMQGLVNLRGRDKSVEFRHIESTPSKQVRFSTYLKFAFLDCEAQREGIIFMELLWRGCQGHAEHAGRICPAPAFTPSPPTARRSRTRSPVRAVCR